VYECVYAGVWGGGVQLEAEVDEELGEEPGDAGAREYVEGMQIADDEYITGGAVDDTLPQQLWGADPPDHRCGCAPAPWWKETSFHRRSGGIMRTRRLASVERGGGGLSAAPTARRSPPPHTPLPAPAALILSVRRKGVRTLVPPGA
jgi:hypothetical protein